MHKSNWQAFEDCYKYARVEGTQGGKCKIIYKKNTKSTK